MCIRDRLGSHDDMALGVQTGHPSWHEAGRVAWQGGRHQTQHVLSVVAGIALGTKHDVALGIEASVVHNSCRLWYGAGHCGQHGT
eukprot:14135564-Ditylum_brightwellii.AAC.1